MNLKIRFFVNLPKIMDCSMIEVLVTVIVQEKYIVCPKVKANGRKIKLKYSQKLVTRPGV